MSDAELEGRAARLRDARQRAGFNKATDAAQRFNWSPSTYMAHENGSRGLRPDSVERYAKAFRVTTAWLMFGTGADELKAELTQGPEAGRLIPIKGEVAAGVWREPGYYEPARDFLHLSVPGYERADLYCLVVRGPSMNEFYGDGHYLIVAPAAQAGVREGDHVIVERNRRGSVETTCKEVVTEGHRVALWPRSSDPRFQDPIYVDSEDQDTPVITGVVVGDFRKRDRGAAPIFVPPND